MPKKDYEDVNIGKLAQKAMRDEAFFERDMLPWLMREKSLSY